MVWVLYIGIYRVIICNCTNTFQGRCLININIKNINQVTFSVDKNLVLIHLEPMHFSRYASLNNLLGVVYCDNTRKCCNSKFTTNDPLTLGWIM